MTISTSPQKRNDDDRCLCSGNSAEAGITNIGVDENFILQEFESFECQIVMSEKHVKPH